MEELAALFTDPENLSVVFMFVVLLGLPLVVYFYIISQSSNPPKDPESK